MAAASAYASPSVVVGGIDSTSPSVISDYCSYGVDSRKGASVCDGDLALQSSHHHPVDGSVVHRSGQALPPPRRSVEIIQNHPSLSPSCASSLPSRPLLLPSLADPILSPRFNDLSQLPPAQAQSSYQQHPQQQQQQLSQGVPSPSAQLPPRGSNEIFPLFDCSSPSGRELSAADISPSSHLHEVSPALEKLSPSHGQIIQKTDYASTLEGPYSRQARDVNTIASFVSALQNENLSLPASMDTADGVSCGSPKEGGIIHRLSFSNDFQTPASSSSCVFSAAHAARPSFSSHPLPTAEYVIPAAFSKSPVSMQGTLSPGIAAATPSVKHFSFSFTTERSRAAGGPLSADPPSHADPAAAGTTDLYAFQPSYNAAASSISSSSSATAPAVSPSTAPAAAHGCITHLPGAAVAANSLSPAEPLPTTGTAGIKAGPSAASHSALFEERIPPSPTSSPTPAAAVPSFGLAAAGLPSSSAGDGGSSSAAAPAAFSPAAAGMFQSPSEAKLRDMEEESGIKSFLCDASSSLCDDSQRALESVFSDGQHYSLSSSQRKERNPPRGTHAEELLSSLGITSPAANVNPAADADAAAADAAAAAAFFIPGKENFPPFSVLQRNNSRLSFLTQQGRSSTNAAGAALAAASRSVEEKENDDLAASGLNYQEDHFQSPAIPPLLPYALSPAAVAASNNTFERSSFFFPDAAAADTAEGQDKSSLAWQRRAGGPGLPSRLFFDEGDDSSSRTAAAAGGERGDRSRRSGVTENMSPEVRYTNPADSQVVSDNTPNEDALSRSKCLLYDESWDGRTCASPFRSRKTAVFDDFSQSRKAGENTSHATMHAPCFSEEAKKHLQQGDLFSSGPLSPCSKGISLPPGRSSCPASSFCFSSSPSLSLPYPLSNPSSARAAAGPAAASAVAAGGSGARNSSYSRSGSCTFFLSRQQQHGEAVEAADEDKEREGNVMGGMRQSAALLPVFASDGEMISHGSRYGGDQPAALRCSLNKRRGNPAGAGGSNKETPLFSDNDEEEKFPKGREPQDIAGWRGAWQQAAGENQILRRRMQEAETQIFALQQSLSKETARATAQTKQQMNLDAALRAARAELLQLRHTLRLHLRGLDLPAGAVVGGASDVRREVILMRQALHEAAEYNAELLEQNESLRVRIDDLVSSPGYEREKDEELRCWRTIFKQLQAVSEISIGDATPAHMELLLEQLHKRKYQPLRHHESLRDAFVAAARQLFTVAPSAVSSTPNSAARTDNRAAAFACADRSADNGALPHHNQEKQITTDTSTAYTCKGRKNNSPSCGRRKNQLNGTSESSNSKPSHSNNTADTISREPPNFSSSPDWYSTREEDSQEHGVSFPIGSSHGPMSAITRGINGRDTVAAADEERTLRERTTAPRLPARTQTVKREFSGRPPEMF